MDKSYVGLGILSIALGFLVAFVTGMSLERNPTVLQVISQLASYLMIIGFMVVGSFLIVIGAKKP
jgi:hypothetical protein